MRLFIVRHGETEENTLGIIQGHNHGVLTKEGLRQAKNVGEKLKSTSFDHIYSSDLQRSIDTAEIIKRYHPDTPLTFTKELRELNLGEFQGKKWVEVDWNSLGEDRMEVKPKNGESLNEMKKRVIDFISTLYQTHKSDKLLLVTHGGVIRQIIAHYEGLPTEIVLKRYSIKNAFILKVEVTSNKNGKILNLPVAFRKLPTPQK